MPLLVKNQLNSSEPMNVGALLGPWKPPMHLQIFPGPQLLSVMFRVAMVEVG